MRVFKGILAFSILGLVIFLSVSCSSGSATPTATTQEVKVQKGNIAVTVVGTGNLAMSNTQDVPFQMVGTVQSVAVNVGDSVKKGQVMATLDTTDRDNQVTTLQKSLDTAQRNVATLQINVTKAQRAVTSAQRVVVEKQLAVSQAQLDEQTAEDAVNQIADVKTAQDLVTADQNKLTNAQMNLQAAGVSGDAAAIDYWNQQIKTLKSTLAQDLASLHDILSGSSVKESNNLNLQIQQLQLNVQQKKQAILDAQTAVDDANTAVDDANTAVTNAQQDEADAEQNVKDIQSNITDTQNQDPTVVAPFDGIVTAVKATGGAQIQKGSVAVSVADPTQFEVNFYVTETDIMSVKIGGAAGVAVDALSGLSYPAKVTAIAPLATIQQGVVNYKVTAQLTSLKPTLAFGQGSSTSGFSGASGGPITVTPPSGNPITITPGASFTPRTNATPGAGSTNTPAGANGSGNSGAFGRAAAALQNITLKDGLSSTVTITIQQANDVLIVPSRAITRVAGKGSTVQLLKDNAVVEQTVTVGLSDSTNTEITQGLNEGDTVIVKTSSSSTTNTNRIPGIGGGGQVFRVGG